MQTIVRTKENVEKKQALTYEEMEAEREDVVLLALLICCFLLFVLLFQLFFFWKVDVWIWRIFEQEEEQADTESDDEEQQIYNPLKLPMGWDGKPIPYWLYKLHGLGQVIICFIQRAV